MLRAFIVRPFNVKEGIDFDRVEKVLIQPALDAVGVSGATTMELAYQGNIREDMFANLLKYDLVVADISIHNANVFYELGVRHALRDKHTYLIRRKCKPDEVPFDLQTDRYLEYDPANPQEAVPLLIDGLRKTVDSDRSDSPVFKLVSGLRAQDWTRFLEVPRDFTEEVVKAAKRQRQGDLDMLAWEVKGLEWEFGGLKQIGRELYSLGFNSSAKAVWERVVAIKDDDAEAWGLLASVYQRLNNAADSERALRRAWDLPKLASDSRAKLLSLRGSHEKRRWTDDWKELDDLKERRKAALVSPHLALACEAYDEGFKCDLNHTYSGLNALALLMVRIELAGAAELAGEWEKLFETDQQANDKLRKLKERRKDLEVVVRCALEAGKRRADKDVRDVWTDVGQAELLCLTGTDPARVARAYGEALVDQSSFDLESVRQKLLIFDRLGLLGLKAASALEKLDEVEQHFADVTAHKPPPYTRVLLFTGHMIDGRNRARPRFPAEAEETVRGCLREVVSQEVKAANGPVLAIAGGACGGDILFQEVCAELKPVEARLYLSVPPETYVPRWVATAGESWVERFYRLWARPARLKPRILGELREMPRWLSDKPDYSLWKRSNLWMACNALIRDAASVKLIALWDGDHPGDGLDGTADMVRLARSRGIEVIHLDTRKLCPV